MRPRRGRTVPVRRGELLSPGRRGHGRDQDTARFQDGKRAILHIATDQVEHNIHIGKGLLELHSPRVNHAVRTECLDVRRISRRGGGDHFLAARASCTA